MKKVVFFIVVAVLLGFAVFGALAKYNFTRNIEAATRSQQTIIGISKKELFDKFGRPEASGSSVDSDGREKEVYLYTTWTKTGLVVVKDGKVASIKFSDIRRSAAKEAYVYLNPKTWLAILSRLFTGESEGVSLSM